MIALEVPEITDPEEKAKLLAAIEEGKEDVRQGRLVPHDEAMKELRKWVRKYSKQRKFASV